LDELNDRIEAIIKAQCTAIHPAVEWRFRQAALKYLRDHNEGVAAGMEPIVFKEVYPLYGLSDIRGSSTIRNNAIRDDLIEQLQMAREIILLAHRQKPLPYLSQLNHRIGQQLHKIEQGLASGDEVSTLEFLRWEVEPHFNHLQTFDESVAQKIGYYQSELNPLVGLVYRKRKDYEESVAALNETVCNFIDAEQERAQAMFPHYFEKYKSDGVEHGVYIGASLVEDGRFDPLYLKNIRLWQLMLLCSVARQAEKLKPQLKIPLELAHLVLVQNMPLSIRFRYDEKKFDVDGTYNVRYEIMKKRIDKAIVKGTEERLTQPRKIAIVYSQAREAAEYREYIDYLQSSGYLTEEVEELELEDLQ
ncbi:MAG: GAF domain-containing protein, partial [bacterium]